MPLPCNKNQKSPSYWTEAMIEYSQKAKEKAVWLMYSMKYVYGHVQVYDRNGKFLFSADSEREAREELEEYEEFAA